MSLMAKVPFINKHGFVEYPFLHDVRKESNWWFFNLLEDYLKRRARQKYGHTYTRDHMDEDMMQFLAQTNLKFFVLLRREILSIYPLILIQLILHMHFIQK